MAKYDGLLNLPATDVNFRPGIERLDNTDLLAMLRQLNVLEEQEHCHKGRIKAVEKELALRDGAAEFKRGRTKPGGNSREIVAMDKYKVDIDTAERLYGDGMPYEKDRIENEIKFYMAQTAQSLFESGKRFLRIKAHEKHGDYMESLSRIGVPDRSADYAMAVVLKFGSNSPALANLGSAKLKMLTVFEEKEIKEYVDGGHLGNIPHDDVASMTTRELEAEVRKLRKKNKEDIASREKVISEKEDKINEMDRRFRGQEPPTKEQLAGAKLDECLQPFNTQLQDAIFAMNRCIDMITQVQRIEAVGYAQLNDFVLKHSDGIAMITEAFGELQGAINDIHIDRIDGSEKAAESPFDIID